MCVHPLVLLQRVNAKAMTIGSRDVRLPVRSAVQVRKLHIEHCTLEDEPFVRRN